MVSYLFGLESMAYLTCGLVDQGVEDYSLESAICKVSGTEFLWYAANRALQLRGGEGYMKTDPYEKIMRDIRIFPIFEGANDVMRAFIALSAMKPVGERLSELGEIGLNDPIRSIGLLADYAASRVKREVRPERISMAHPELAAPCRCGRRSGQGARGRDREPDPQAQEGRDAAAARPEAPRRRDLRRLRAGRGAQPGDGRSSTEDGVEPSGQERYIADTFCTRAASRVRGHLRQIESNDDERMTAIAKLAYRARRLRLRPLLRLTGGGRAAPASGAAGRSRFSSSTRARRTP